MSLSKLPIETITDESVKLVYKEVGLEVEKLEHCLKLVKQWLKCETHLPNDVDETLLRNFILGSKGNVERTKEKLEQYIIAKTKMVNVYSNRDRIKDEDFSLYPIHQIFYISPKLTLDGDRIILFKIPIKDPTHFSHVALSRYFCILLDVLLYHDTSAGYIFVFDMTDFTPAFLAKFNIRLAKEMSELIYKTAPLRIKCIQVINDSPAINTLMNIMKLFMSQKLKDRISTVTAEDLLKFYPKDYLPIEYGGTAGKFEDRCNSLFEVLKESRDWCLKSEEPKLIGPVPENKKNLYSFDDLSMDGSFRKLNVF